MHPRPRPFVLAALVVLASARGARAQHRDASSSAHVDAAADAPLSAADVARRARVVARVGEHQITVGELEDMLNEAPAPVRQTYTDPARRREVVENLIGSQLLADEARRRGIDRRPETSAALRRVLAQQLQRRVVLDAITLDSIAPADVRAYYDAHVTQYQQPEYRRATALFVDDRAAAEQLSTAARATHGDMRRVIALVRERSTDQATREHDGDLFYFQRSGDAQATPHAVDPAVAAAAFALAHETDVSPPVQTANNKWAVVVLTGIRPALSRSFADTGVVNSIRGVLVRQRRDEAEAQLLQGLRDRMHPEMHPERLELIHVPPADLGAMPPFGAGGGLPRRSPDPRTPVAPGLTTPPATPTVAPAPPH